MPPRSVVRDRFLLAMVLSVKSVVSGWLVLWGVGTLGTGLSVKDPLLVLLPPGTKPVERGVTWLNQPGAVQHT